MDKDNRLNLSSISWELALLLEFIQKETENPEWSFNNLENIDWDYFLQLSRHHRLYPILYSKIKDVSGIPSSVVQTLFQEYKANTIQMLALCGEMDRVSRLFNEHQIPLLFMKGPVIANDIYGNLSLRTSRDLDILISPSHFEIADKLLLGLGYVKETVPFLLDIWKWRGYHIVYTHPEKKVVLEVHWRLEPLPWKQPAFDELWKRKRVSHLTSTPVYYLGEEDLYLYLMAHGARHGWFRLRWVMDIDQMVRRGYNFERAVPLFNKYKKSHIGGQALILASELFKTPIDSDLKKLMQREDAKELAQNAIEFIIQIDSLENISSTDSFKKYNRSLNRWKQIYDKLILIFPTFSDFETLKLPKPFHFLYYPLRPFLAIVRLLKKNTYTHGDLK